MTKITSFNGKKITHVASSLNIILQKVIFNLEHESPKTVVCVQGDDFRIIYIPRGSETIARMELNETF